MTDVELVEVEANKAIHLDADLLREIAAEGMPSVEALKALMEDFRTAGVVYRARLLGPTHVVATPEVVLQDQPITKPEFLRLLTDTASRDDLSWVQTETKTLEWTTLHGRPWGEILSELDRLSFQTAFVASLTKEGSVRYQSFHVRP